MTDVVDRATRSRMMSGIGTKNTKPELVVRQLLTAHGFRFRLQRRDLPGKPDIVLLGYDVAIQVNGCFWHGHNCRLFKWPKSNPKFWREKIGGNQQRDRRNESELKSLGWHVLNVWECAIKNKSPEQLERLGEKMAAWIEADSTRIRLKNLRER